MAAWPFVDMGWRPFRMVSGVPASCYFGPVSRVLAGIGFAEVAPPWHRRTFTRSRQGDGQMSSDDHVGSASLGSDPVFEPVTDVDAIAEARAKFKAQGVDLPIQESEQAT